MQVPVDGVNPLPSRYFSKPVSHVADGFSFSTEPSTLFRVFILTGFLLAFPRLAVALHYSATRQTQSFEISRIRFIGNQTFSSDVLLSIIRSKESPGAVSQFLGHISEKLGSPPEYYSRPQFSDDASQVETYYHDQGFYDVTINPEARLDTAHHTATLLFLISEHLRSYIDSMAYLGLNSIDPELLHAIYSDPILKKQRPFVKSLADAEIHRVLGLLTNGGYPAARYDWDHSGAYRHLSTNNFTLVFAFLPGRQYHFGQVEVNVDPPRPDIDSSLVLRHLEFEPGDIYSDEKRSASQRNLARLDLFQSVRILQPRIVDSAMGNEIPMRIIAVPRDRHELSPEITLSDENNAFNLGLGLGYTNRNFFGDARTMHITGRTRFQSLSHWNFGEFIGGKGFRDSNVTGAVELQLQVLQPYLFTKNLSGTWETSVMADKEQPYILLSILRNKLGLSNRFATYTIGTLEWTLERVNPEILVSNSTASQLFASLLDEDKPQFNSILTLTLQRDKTNDIFSPSGGFFHSLTLEESGILPKLLPGVRGSLPFTQYYKVVLFGRWYEDLSRDTTTILALKLKSGYQAKYGESRSADILIPLNRRFFAGGSGSVRGWQPRDLGAMADPNLAQLGGNFIIEENLELRVNHFKGMGKIGFIRMNNIWGAYFIDAGNVWNGIEDFRMREIAVAAGFGIRYDTYFGPFRIDYGFKVYDPRDVEGHQTIFRKKFWSETFSGGVLHFGIGQAF